MLVLVLCLSSCGKKEKVISRGDMAKIYAEMFITDQRLGKVNKTRKMADTSFVYEPIFEKYGYTTEDYNASVDYYINDATRYARILRQSSVIIEKEIRELKKEKELQDLSAAAGNILRFRPERLYFLTGLTNPRVSIVDSLTFYVDSTGGKLFFDDREWSDTAFYGPRVVIRSEQRRGARYNRGEGQYDADAADIDLEDLEDSLLNESTDSLELSEPIAPAVENPESVAGKGTTFRQRSQKKATAPSTDTTRAPSRLKPTKAKIATE